MMQGLKQREETSMVEITLKEMHNIIYRNWIGSLLWEFYVQL